MKGVEGMDVEGIIRRLDTELEKARRNNCPEVVRLLTIIRYGSLFGSKHDAQRIIRDHYLKGGVNYE